MIKNTIKFKSLSFIFLSLFLISPVLAEENQTDDLKITGNIQSRSELDNRDFNGNTSPLFFTSLRTSIGVEKTFFEKYKLFAQVRDSRIMGESANTLANFKNLDLHQGFISIQNLFNLPMGVQLGRFEMNYGTQRFIGSVDWHYVARSFDGIKVNYTNKEMFNFSTDIFALFPNSNTPYIGNALPKTYTDMFSVSKENKEASQTNHEMYGFWSKAVFSPLAEVDIFGWLDDYKNLRRTEIEVTAPQTGKVWKSTFTDKKLVTVGANYKGKYGNFSSLFEGAYQVGKIDEKVPKSNNVDKSNFINAYLVSGQFFYNPLTELKFGLGADIVSGDPNGQINQAFETAYGTNHLFYGYMDYFINVSKDTKYLGLNDFYFTSAWKREDFPLGVYLNVHHLMANQPLKSGERNFGQELDLTLKYKLYEKVNVTLGGSAFINNELMNSNSFFGKANNSISYWSYFMVSAGF